MIWLILLTILCVLFYYIAIKPLSYWKDRGIVHKKPLPIVGNSIPLLLQKVSITDHAHNLYKEFSNERYFGSHQFLKPVLFINDLELIKKITVKDFEHFIDHNALVSAEIDPLIGKNLINLTGQNWRDMRATLSPSFTSSKMKMMFGLVSECAENFTKYFEKQEKDLIDLEMKDVFTRFTNDAIATVAFGLKCDSLEDKDNDFYRMGKKAATFSGSTFVTVLLYTTLPKLTKLLGLRIISKSVSKFFKNVIDQTLYKREKEGLVRPDMIHLLVEARKCKNNENEDSRKAELTIAESQPKMDLSNEDITAQAMIFFLGGFDTSSTLMSFLAYELAINEDVQKRLQDEIDETLRECNGKLTYDALHKMKYMDMVVSETLRLWPPVPFLDRKCVKDYTIEPLHPWEKSFTIEKDTFIQIPVVGIHRNKIYFPEPEKFDPERFSDENRHNIELSAYLPFGAGPRICIASRFAQMENKTMLFHLLSKFDIVKTKKTSYPIKLAASSFNIGPSEGFWLGLKRR